MMLESVWLVHPDPVMCAAWETRFAGLPNVRVVRGRFEELEPHDCFVTAGNSFGIMTAGIDAAVVRVFGDELMRRVQHRIMDRYLGEQPVGTAFLVDTGHPAIPFVAHAPTMRVPGSIEGTTNVYTATWAALLAIHAHNQEADEPLRTAAFPAMGAGFGQVPYDEVARQMAAAWRHYHDPPHRLDWSFVTARHKAISFDGTDRLAR
jgi:O-acetyl-ADP-ribose deacetylase (regulator of RNase III)